MEKKFKVALTYTVRGTHPDLKYIKNVNEKFTREDTYTIDMNYFVNIEHALEYIQNDMLLIANGGYELGHINIIDYEIKEISEPIKNYNVEIVGIGTGRAKKETLTAKVRGKEGLKDLRHHLAGNPNIISFTIKEEY